MKIAIRHCRDCRRAMISKNQYNQNAALRTKHVAHAAHGMCAGCYNTARHYTNKPNQPANRRYQRRITADQPCRGCGRAMMSVHKYYSPRARRSTHVPLGTCGMCRACYRRAERHNTLPDPPPPTRERDPCRGCGHAMISRNSYRRRPELRGQHKQHEAHGLCKYCYHRVSTYGTLPGPAPEHARKPCRKPAERFRERPVVGSRQDNDGPLNAAELAKLRAAVGVTR